MRRISYRPYIFLILFFFFLMSLPQGAFSAPALLRCLFVRAWLEGVKKDATITALFRRLS